MTETRQDEGVRERASSSVQQAASTTQEKAVELREKTAGQLRQQLDTRTTEVGGQAKTVAQALRRSGDDLRGQGNNQAAGVTEGAAERVERFAEYLERVDGDEMLRDVERFARQRPWLLAGIGLFAGLVASRVMKASSERRYTTGTHRQYGAAYIPPSAMPTSDYERAEPMRSRAGEFDEAWRES